MAPTPAMPAAVSAMGRRSEPREFRSPQARDSPERPLGRMSRIVSPVKADNTISPLTTHCEQRPCRGDRLSFIGPSTYEACRYDETRDRGGRLMRNRPALRIEPRIAIQLAPENQLINIYDNNPPSCKIHVLIQAIRIRGRSCRARIVVGAEMFCSPTPQMRDRRRRDTPICGAADPSRKRPSTRVRLVL